MKKHITVHIPGKSDRKMSLFGYITVHIPWPILMVFLSFLQQKSLKPDIAFPLVVVTVLTPSSFCGYISFSITIQHRFTILGPHIDNDVYISARHVPHDLDLIFMVYWLLNLHQVFMIRSVSLLTYNLGHTLIKTGTCQLSMCYLTVTSFSHSDIVQFIFNFGD